MAYEVKPRTRKDGTPYWRLIHRRFENGKPKDKHIPETEYAVLGLRAEMTVADAKARVKQINATDKLQKIEAKRVVILERAQKSSLIQSVFLPPIDCGEFEQKLFKTFGRGNPNSRRYKKMLSHWRYVQKMVAHVALDPSDWCDEAIAFYNYFATRQSSPEYVSKLLRVLNLWGHFYCKKYGKSFLAIPAPTGYERERIAEAYQESDGYEGESDPLSPALLEQFRNKFLPGQYAWLYLSVWFGLRPQEIDNLLQTDKWKITVENDGTEVLWVYQSKLTNVPKEKRWKPIPVVCPEQKHGLDLIKGGSFDRPLVKTLRKHLPGRITLYGGRKGFTSLMLSRGERLEDISIWMGHHSIERTWRSYKNKQEVRYTERRSPSL